MNAPADVAPLSMDHFAIDSHPSEPLTETERRVVKQLRSGRTSLPMLPHVASVALSLANDHDASVLELAELVDGDPPIAARFLSVANSAAYWRGHAAASTQAAIVRLGLAATRDLLFQVVYASSSAGLKRHQKAVQKSFQRSVRCGIVARELCRELREPYEYAYMCGLLHDIGEARVYRILEQLPPPPEGAALIRDLVARYHATAGAEVAMAWRLPPDIVDVCAAHHEASRAHSFPVRLTMIADCIVDALDNERAKPWEVLDLHRLESLGVDGETAVRLVQVSRDALVPLGLELGPPSHRPRSDPGSRFR